MDDFLAQDFDANFFFSQTAHIHLCNYKTITVKIRHFPSSYCRVTKPTASASGDDQSVLYIQEHPNYLKKKEKL